MYVKEFDTRDRRMRRKYEPRHEITCVIPYANNKDIVFSCRRLNYLHFDELLGDFLGASNGALYQLQLDY